MKNKNIEDKYLKMAAELSSTLNIIIATKLEGLPTEYAFKIGCISLSSILSDFCYCILKKDCPTGAQRLLKDILMQAEVFLEAKYNKETIQ